jgi:hypothetical protein
MNKAEIQQFWKDNYSLCPPINHLFKVIYNDRWLRIHSLPDSKRYADNEYEWAVLYQTQNNILDDIFIKDDTLYLFVGILSSDTYNVLEDEEIEHECLQTFDFTALEIIDLHALTKEYYDEDIFYTPYYTSLKYKSNAYNEILKSIANDELRAFFLNPTTDTIFAPYDGGVDIIYADTASRDEYKLKYNHYTQQENYR